MDLNSFLNNPPNCINLASFEQVWSRKNNFVSLEDVPSYCVLESASKETPTVSIMIPTYRRPVLLRQSVESALRQRCSASFEVVIVDNESDDRDMQLRVKELLIEFGAENLRYFRNAKNLGMFGNWNRCIQLAGGELTCILNDDDLLDPDYISAALERLAQFPNACGVAVEHRVLNELEGAKVSQKKKITGLRQLDRRLFRRPRVQHLEISQFALAHCIHGSLGVLVKKSVMLQFGGFDPGFFPASDLVFWLNVINAERLLWLETPLCTYRLAANESLKPDVARSFVLAEYFVREAILRKTNRSGKIGLWLNRIYTSLTLSNRDFGKKVEKGNWVERVSIGFRPLLTRVCFLFLKCLLR